MRPMSTTNSSTVVLPFQPSVMSAAQLVSISFLASDVRIQARHTDPHSTHRLDPHRATARSAPRQ